MAQLPLLIQAATAASDDPLAALRDIHLPPPVASWPPAPGWWLLAAFLLLLVIGIPLWLWLRHRRRYWRWARAELATIDRQLTTADDPRPLLLALATLIRRVALCRAPARHAASQHGADWQAFLTDGPGGLSAADAELLATAPYLPPPQLAQLTIDRRALVAAVRRWLKENG